MGLLSAPPMRRHPNLDANAKINLIQVDAAKNRNEKGQIIINIEKYTRKDLNEAELQELYTYYWAAHFGFKETVMLMILYRKWSIFMKAFYK